MAAANGICILIAEDHEDSLEALARILRLRGYTVYTARTADEARELAGANRCDLFIGDIGLPGGNGLDLMRELRQRHGLRGIVVSGFAAKQDVRDALAAGYEKHIAKPVAYPELLAAVEEMVGAGPGRDGPTGDAPRD